MTNINKLKAIMSEHNLDRYAIATLLSVRKSTVDTWHGKSRNMPDQMLELLQYKLKVQQWTPSISVVKLVYTAAS